MTLRNVEENLKRLNNESLQLGFHIGLEIGLQGGLAKAALAAYRARFGAPPAYLTAAVKQACDDVKLERWLELVTTRSAEEIAAALRRPRRAQAAEPTKSRRSASPRRTSAAR